MCTKGKHRPYVAYVEGRIDGVPFVQYHKRRDTAVKLAIKCHGTFVDMITHELVDYSRPQSVSTHSAKTVDATPASVLSCECAIVRVPWRPVGAHRP